MSAAAQELFELKSIAKCSKIRLSAVSQAIERQLVALVLSCGDLVLYHSLRENEVPQLRWIPWFEEASKEVQCLTFDPLSGAWLLLACFDGSLQIVPIFSLFGQRTPPEAGLNNWSRDDVTSVHYGNTANLSAAELCPTAVTWWVRQSPDVDRTTRDIAIVGTKGGHVIFVSLLSGTVVGSTTVDGAVAMLNVCRSDDSLSEETTIILLVTGLNQQQWKVILEHRETGTYWPFMADSKLNESSISSGSYEPDELHSRLSFPSFPAARTRLQGLKQLSVEKLTSLRQKITDSRSRGLAGGPSLKRKNSSSSEDSLSRYRLPVDGCSDGGLAASNSPRILSMANIQLSAQHLHKRTFLTSYYSPVNIVTVYCTSVDMNPVSVHKLCVPCGSLLLCDHLFYVKSADGKKLTIISTRLSECHANSEKHLFNSDVPLESMLQEFEMKNDEFIVNLHRIPAIPSSANDKSLDGRKSHRNKKGKSGCSHMEVNCKDLCAVVTNMALYIVKLRAVHEEVLACVKDVGRMEEGERLARIFGLDLQKLLELAADQQLDAGMLESGISLYTLSKCRPLKSVLRLAAAGYTVHMLQHILALLKAVELSPSEQLHLSTLCLLSYTEQILRSKPPDRNNLTNSFKEFLSENSQYDEALAVNIIAQSGLCRILTHLSNNRGLHTLVADILARLLTHINDQAHRIDLELADGFWECLSERLLCESHLVNADVARTHIDFVKHKLPLLTETILERLAFGYDPSRPALRPVINRFVKEMSSTSDSKLNGMTIDIVQSPDSLFPFGEWLTLYLLTCVYLAHARALTLDLLSPLLSDYDDHASCHDKPLFPTSPTVPLPLPVLETPFVKPPILNAGFTHAALVRNKQLIMWGQTANGCLGSGPNLNKTANPSVIGLFPQLSLSVIGVACGRFHTLALTENGVYSWGSSKYGQLGVGKVMQSSQPRLIDTLANRRVVSVECGQYHSLALTDDGKLYTWGWGVHGQLGHGSVEDHHYPTLIQNLSNEMCVSCSGGHAHSLALTSSGRVWAFGSSVFGQLGTGNNVKSSRPVQVYGLPEKIVMISTAYFHNLGLAASNRLYTWGSSPQVLRLQAQAQKRARARAQHMQQQQQQEGAATVSAVQIQEPTASVAANDSTAVPAQQQPALGGTNAAVATPTPPGTLNLQPAEEGGEDSDGKMSRPHFKMAPTSRFVTMNSEMVVSPSTEMKALPAGRNVNDVSTTPSSFSIENGPVSNPVVGLDDALAHLSPTLVDTSHVEGRITMISCGCHHSALLTDNGRVHTWGRNLDGQLGNGARTKEALHPTQINIGDPVEAELQYVVCGGEFTLGMEANGKVWAWGSNMHGQLGRTPVEDSTKAGMVLLKTSKRIIKLPHGSLNSADSPTEITGLPPFELYDSGVTAHKLYLNGATPLAEMENPPHGLRTLHYALHQYKGYYDTKEILNKCLELEDWCTASKLLALDGHLDRALRYRLKAVAAAAEVTATANASSVSTPLNKTSSSTMTTTTEGTTEEEEEEEDEDEVEEEVTADTATATSTTEATDCSEQTEEETSSSSSSRTVTTTRKAVEGVVEAMAAGSGGTLMKLAGGGRQVRRIHEPRQCQTCNNVILATIDDSSSSMDEVATSADENSANEIHTFAVQGGTEEMSSCSQDSDTAKTSDTPSLSDDVFESRSETPPSDSNTATAAGPASFSCCQDGGSQPNRGRLSAALVQQTSCDSSATECRLSDEGSSPAAAEKAYTTAIDSYTRVVAAYLKAYADRPLPVLRDLLYQALDFWIEQSLPVSTLENFLREHWDLVHYPLGVLLFGNEPKSSDAEKILCRLSTDFSLLLCSSMVEHVSDKKKPCPEMVEMLAGLSWNGGMDTDCGSEMADPEARLSRVLEDLYNPQELQPFIDISFPVGEESCNGLTPSEVIAFSCGHRYEGVASLHKAAGGVAHTLDHRNSLPATAHALLRIFQQPQLVRHFACPQCILGCIEAEMQ